MSLSKLAEKCKKCPEVDTCDHKYMEAVGFLPGEPTMEQTMTIMEPGIRITGGDVNILIPASKIVSANLQVNHIDSLRDQINSQFGVPANLLGGNHGKK